MPSSTDIMTFWANIFPAQITASVLDTSLHIVTFTGNDASSTTGITNVSSTAGLQVGMVVTGGGFPAATIITSIGTTTLGTNNQSTTTDTGATFTAAFYLYTWEEMTWDMKVGSYVTMQGGRSGSNNGNPAIEVNNINVDSTVLPLFVQMRYRSTASGDILFEFQIPSSVGTSATTLPVVTSVCATFLPGPLPVGNGGSGQDNSGGGGFGDGWGQGSSGGPAGPSPSAGFNGSQNGFGYAL